MKCLEILTKMRHQLSVLCLLGGAGILALLSVQVFPAADVSARGTDLVLIAVRSKASGTVAVVYVRAGDHVQEGDPLADLDAQTLRLQRQLAQDELESQQAKLEIGRAHV